MCFQFSKCYSLNTWIFEKVGTMFERQSKHFDLVDFTHQSLSYVLSLLNRVRMLLDAFEDLKSEEHSLIPYKSAK